MNLVYNQNGNKAIIRTDDSDLVVDNYSQLEEILKVENLTKIVDGKKILDKVSFTVLRGDKICFLAKDDMAKTTLFNILTDSLSFGN